MVVFLVLLGNITIDACNCSQWDYEVKEWEDLDTYDLVENSIVTSIDTVELVRGKVPFPLTYVKVRLKTLNVIKGKREEETVLLMPINSCSFALEIKEQYLFCLTKTRDDFYSTSKCSGTIRWGEINKKTIKNLTLR